MTTGNQSSTLAAAHSFSLSSKPAPSTNKRKRSAKPPQQPKPNGATTRSKAKPKPKVAKLPVLEEVTEEGEEEGKHHDDEDICPVCDSDCKCGDVIVKQRNGSGIDGEDDEVDEEEEDLLTGQIVNRQTSSKSLSSLRRIFRNNSRNFQNEFSSGFSGASSSSGSESESLSTLTDFGPAAPFDFSSDSSSLSSEDAEMLKMEERNIRMNGMDSDEESNLVPSSESSSTCSSSASSSSPSDSRLHEFPIVDDPNEIDMVWSSGCEDENTHNGHNAHHSTKLTLHDIPEITFPLPRISSPMTPNNRKRSRTSCKRRLSATTANSDKDDSAEELLPLPTPSTSPSIQPTSDTNSKTTAHLSPEMIQAYLASRGIHITTERASHFAETLSSGNFFSFCNNSNISTEVSKHKNLNANYTSGKAQSYVKKQQEENSNSGNHSHENTIFTSRYSAPDPRLLSKEAKQMEALQAQAIGGMSSKQSSTTPSNGSKQPQNQPFMKSEQPLNSFVTLEEILDLDSTSSDENESQTEESSGVSSSLKDGLKWDRIPIGTFRRSRKVSAPLLKLSKAVKSTFGVVPSAIHETLLGCGGSDENVRLPDSVLYLPYKSHSKSTGHGGKNVSVLVGPPTHELGMGSYVEKKLSSKKYEIIKTARKREKEVHNLLHLTNQPFTINSTSAAKTDQQQQDDACCSCSDCEPDDDQFGHHSYNDHDRSMRKKRSRRSSLALEDLSYLIHDPSHPPSACASPDNLFINSPGFFPTAAQSSKTHAEDDTATSSYEELESFCLEPSAYELLISSTSNSSQPDSNNSTSKRKRKSSVFNAGKMSVSNLEPLLKFF